MKVKAELDRLEIENFVPMRYKMVDDGSEIPRRDLVPAINNLIFVRSTQERISGLKASNEVLEGVASVAIASGGCRVSASPLPTRCSTRNWATPDRTSTSR